MERRDLLKFTMVLLCCALSGLAQAGELFRWVDADGKVHYTDQPPPASAKKVEEKKLSGSTIDTSEMPYALRQAIKKSPNGREVELLRRLGRSPAVPTGHLSKIVAHVPGRQLPERNAAALTPAKQALDSVPV